MTDEIGSPQPRPATRGHMMLDPWTTTERAATILTYAAYLLTFAYVYPRIKAWRPHWQGRAEFAAMIPGVGMLLLLTLFVTGF